MEKHNIWIKAVWLLCSMVGGLLSTSCSEEYLTYDTDYSGIYFSDDTLHYSFGVTPTNICEKEYMIPVCLMGKPSSD